ncbi:MAG: hypothetical protein IJB52_10700 [Clostridia bacterium]|nr:hypothetical protein [Clostridia bacterium]
MKMSALYKEFQNPGAPWRGKPFWSWNGELDREELIHQSHILGEMGFGGYFMHSRSGLITEYLGDEWFDLINSTADAGEKEGLEIWLYDEDRWPSGSAGGKVTEDPQYRMKSLMLFETDPAAFEWGEDIIHAFAAVIGEDRLTMHGYRKLENGEDPADALASLTGEGTKKILAFRIVPDKPNSNYNGNTYIDTMSYAAVEKFIELTHEEYRKRCGDRIGRSIKGIFSDEPHRGTTMDKTVEKDGVRTCPISWTDDLFDEFMKRYGYDVRPFLPEIFYRPDGEKLGKVRINYIDLCCNLFNERFAVPINQWCEKNGMIFTGHVLHENSMTNQTVPNGSLMRFYQNMGYPGIDMLTDKDFSYWVPKQLSSVCRQTGKKWMLSELYGCTGWELPLRQHKVVGDWQALFGINVRCPHLSWYTMEGESKRDYPASISYQSPYWQDYSFVETYFARLGVMLTQGQACCDVLVLNPIESVWGLSHIGWAQWISPTDPDVHALEAEYARTFRYLTGNRIDFDYGEEQIMAENHRFSKEQEPLLHVGEASYRIVVVSGMLTMRETTYEILKTFLADGGKVIFAGELPAYLNGLPSDACRELLELGAVQVPLEQVSETIWEMQKSMAGAEKIRVDAGEKVFLQTRQDGTSFTAVLLNTDAEHAADNITVHFCAGEGYQAQVWDPENGKRYVLSAAEEKNGIAVTVSLEAAGSMILVFTRDAEDLPVWNPSCGRETGKLTDGEYAYELDEPNVCVLDYTRMKFDTDTEFGELDEVLRIDNRLRDRLGIERRGGEMLQPWFAKMKYTVPYGKLTLEYPFFVDVLPEGTIWLAGERPEVQEYYCNGVRLTNTDPHDWWVDNAFKKMEIPAGVLKTGENVITIVTDFKRTTNIEAVYLLGQFGVIAKAGASRLVKLPETLSLTDTAERNLPFYSGRVTLVIPEQTYGSHVDKAAEKILVKISHGTGTLISVETSKGKQAVAWEPWTADVTEAVKAGENLRITLVNSRRNSFGPLHCVPTLQWAYGPGNFVTDGAGFSDEYARVPAAVGEIGFLCE